MPSKTLLISAQSFLKSKPLMELARSSAKHHGVEIKAAPVAINGRLDEAMLSEIIEGCSYWIVGREPVNSRLLSSAKNLEIVSKYGVGLDNVDIAACDAHGVKLVHRPGVNAQAVAEHALGLMLGLARKICEGSRHLFEGRWLKNGGVSLSGKTIGIIGYGHVGSALAPLVRSFGCQILAHDILDKSEQLSTLGGQSVSLKELLTLSDFISVHVPLTQKTLGLIGRAEFELMKPTSFFINTSRGEVVDESALKWALKSGEIGGAALDVFSEEPFADHELLSLANFIGTPHTAGNSKEAVWAMGQAAVEELFGGINRS